MAQINVSKLNMYARFGPDGLSVSKLNMYARLVPGEGGGEAGTTQAHIYAQKIVRS